MHKKFPNFYHFVEDLNIKKIIKVDKKIAIIYRNYKDELQVNKIIDFRNFCKKTRRIFLISNNRELAFKLNLDGVYIPAFNKKIFNKYKGGKFITVGSAHTLKEIRIKEMQKVEQIFISPIFKTNKSIKYLGLIKFNLLSKCTKKPIIALGGINEQNINKIKMTKSIGIASISYINRHNSFSKIRL